MHRSLRQDRIGRAAVNAVERFLRRSPSLSARAARDARRRDGLGRSVLLHLRRREGIRGKIQSTEQDCDPAQQHRLGLVSDGGA